MKKKIFSLAGICLIFILFGCSSGGSSSNGYNPYYELFPDGYFTAGYEEFYNLTGSDTSGGEYTGTLSIKTEAPKTFNDEQSIPVTKIISLVNTVNKISTIQTITEYFSTDTDNRLYLGYENNTNGATINGTPTSAIPQSAALNAAGQLGVYNYSNGDTISPSWYLEDAGSRYAYLQLGAIRRNEGGATTSYEKDTYIIDHDGTRRSVTIELYSGVNVITINLSSD